MGACTWKTFQIFVFLLLFLSLILPVSSLHVVLGSKCTAVCTEYFFYSNTTVNEVTCHDSDYNTTSVGQRFKECINCELQSQTFDHGTNQTDLGWALCKYYICRGKCPCEHDDNLDWLVEWQSTSGIPWPGVYLVSRALVITAPSVRVATLAGTYLMRWRRTFSMLEHQVPTTTATSWNRLQTWAHVHLATPQSRPNSISPTVSCPPPFLAFANKLFFPFFFSFFFQIWTFSVQHANSRFPSQPPFPSSDPKSSQAAPLTTTPHPKNQLQTAFPTEQDSQSESPSPLLCFYSLPLPFSSGTFATTSADAAAYQTKSSDSPLLPPNLSHPTKLCHPLHLEWSWTNFHHTTHRALPLPSSIHRRAYITFPHPTPSPNPCSPADHGPTKPPESSSPTPSTTSPLHQPPAAQAWQLAHPFPHFLPHHLDPRCEAHQEYHHGQEGPSSLSLGAWGDSAEKKKTTRVGKREGSWTFCMSE